MSPLANEVNGGLVLRFLLHFTQCFSRSGLDLDLLSAADVGHRWGAIVHTAKVLDFLACVLGHFTRAPVLVNGPCGIADLIAALDEGSWRNGAAEFQFLLVHARACLF